jgi:hypothetical protein
MKTPFLVASVIASLCAGCADVMTINRTTELPDNSIENGKGRGVAIHLDAPQRLVYAGVNGDICAEPSPDALQAYAASLGASLISPGNESAALAGALSGNAAGLGLRTQAITLMRDHLYRICEARHNKSLVDGDVMQLLERSQDLTLGVLAIEQLTGAVVARQPILTMGANADASANANNTQKALDQAKKDEANKKEGIPALKEAQDKAQSAVNEASKQETAAKTKAAVPIATIEKLTPELDTEKNKLEAENASLLEVSISKARTEARIAALAKSLEQAKKDKRPQEEIDKVQADIDEANKQLKTDSANVAAAQEKQRAQQLKVDEITTAIQAQENDENYKAYIAVKMDLKSKQDALAKAEEALTSAQADYEQAQKVTESIQTNLNAALASGQATAKGEGSFAQASDRNNISKDTVAQLSAATVDIVKTIVNKGHLTDTCANIITSATTNIRRDAAQQATFLELLPLCKQVFEANVQAYLDSVKGNRPPPPPLLRAE